VLSVTAIGQPPLIDMIGGHCSTPSFSFQLLHHYGALVRSFGSRTFGSSICSLAVTKLCTGKTCVSSINRLSDRNAVGHQSVGVPSL
jgi:hypothetical protein